MKKVIFIIALLAATSMGISSCTEQEVKPKNGGTSGNPIDPRG